LSLIRIRSKRLALERNITFTSTNEETIDDQELDGTKPLTLEGNLKIVFLLFGRTVCIGCLVFMGESIYWQCRKVYHVITKTLGVLRRTIQKQLSRCRIPLIGCDCELR
jgi:hypothetical protein